MKSLMTEWRNFINQEKIHKVNEKIYTQYASRLSDKVQEDFWALSEEEKKYVVEDWIKQGKPSQHLMENTLKDSKRVAKAVIYENNNVLLIKRSPDSENFPNNWDLPGGHTHVGEELKTGLRREVREETGLRIGDVSPLYSVGDESFFKTPLPGKNINLSHEHTDYKLVNVDEILDYPDLSPKYKKVILRAMNRGS